MEIEKVSFNISNMEFGVKGIVRVNTKKGIASFETSDLKTVLAKIEAFNVLLELGKSTKKHVKDDELLKQLTDMIDGTIEVVSAEPSN